MAHILPARARETSATTGTGAYTTSGVAAPGGFTTLAAKLTAAGDTGWFCVVMGNSYEIVRLRRTSATVYSRDVIYDGSNGTSPVNWTTGTKDVFSILPPVGVSTKHVLRADTTIYVRADSTGNTARDGSADTTASAFLTWQAAYEFARDTYDFNGYTVTIRAGGIGIRTFSATNHIVINGRVWTNGRLTFLGNTADPTEVRLDATGANCIEIDAILPGTLRFEGLRLSATTKLIYAAGLGDIKLKNIYFVSPGTVSRVVETNRWIRLEDESGGTCTVDTHATAVHFIDSSRYLSSGTWHYVPGRVFTTLVEMRFMSDFHFANITGSPNGAITLYNNSHLRVTDGQEGDLAALTKNIEPGSTYSIGNVGSISLANRVRATATNDDATTGDVGEYFEATATPGSVSLTTGVVANVIGLNLAAGNWLVAGYVDFMSPNSLASWTRRVAGISTVTGTTTGVTISHNMPAEVVGNDNNDVTIPTHRIKLASAQNIWLVGSASFTAGTAAAGGKIFAWRPR